MEWSANFYSDGVRREVGGYIDIEDATPTSLDYAFRESYSKRENISSILATSLVELSQAACELMLMRMQDFLETKTKLTPSDFGFNF